MMAFRAFFAAISINYANYMQLKMKENRISAITIWITDCSLEE
jgi:hypothetical protein